MTNYCDAAIGEVGKIAKADVGDWHSHEFELFIQLHTGQLERVLGWLKCSEALCTPLVARDIGAGASH
jgi:hypothetical protein